MPSILKTILPDGGDDVVEKTKLFVTTSRLMRFLLENRLSMCSTDLQAQFGNWQMPRASSIAFGGYLQPLITGSMTANPVAGELLPRRLCAAFLHQPHIPRYKGDMVYAAAVLSALWNSVKIKQDKLLAGGEAATN